MKMAKRKVVNKKDVSFDEEIERIAKLETRIHLLEKNCQKGDDFVKELVEITSKMSTDTKKIKFKKVNLELDDVHNEEIITYV